MDAGAINELIGSRGRRGVTIWKDPEDDRPPNALPSLVILLIRSISRYYRDNEYPEAIMI